MQRKSPKRKSALIKRCMDRAGPGSRRAQRVYSFLTLEEAAAFFELRRLLGLSSSQAVRFLILK